ncbi:MAG: lytic transglycosylase domain-containing protein, partial [Firmicutes bacterium]|nr:lytic transglycosylase domain-containing protein [Bacillota bacterium]
ALLAAVMKTESNFNSRAVSDKGARGLMQVMPDTGRWIAKQMGEPVFDPDRLFDPETSIKLGAWYIADLKREFRGDAVLILAAYNGGRGNVKEWISKNGLSAGEGSIDRIPFPETRQYVRKVLIYQKVYKYLYKE